MNVAYGGNGLAATERQIGFLASLRAERDIDPEGQAWLDARLPGRDGEAPAIVITKAEASIAIERLLARPKRQAATGAGGSLPDVPEGRYALPGEGDQPDITFWRVDRPTEGKWAGRVFVKPVYGAPGSLRTGNNVYGATRQAVLAAIARDPAEASRRFGLELGTCGVCGSPLTNEESRALGIGPICRAKTGW